jgi:hypothetical protein
LATRRWQENTVAGHPRDEARNDIMAGRPTLAPDLDELARRVNDLLDVKQATQFWNGIEQRIKTSQAYVAWLRQPETCLQNIDPDATEIIRQRLSADYLRAIAEARRRGWEVE